MEEGGEWVHYGLTSSDVLDTAGGVIMSKAGAILMEKTIALFDIVKARALEHRNTVMVGRTHGIWAEPTSFGLKLAGWAFEVARAHERLSTATATVSVGKISGAVGTYAHTPAGWGSVCARLGLQPSRPRPRSPPRPQPIFSPHALWEPRRKDGAEIAP